MTFYLVSVKDKVAFHKGMCERVINKLVNILKYLSSCSLERLIYVYSFPFILVARVVPQSWILSLKTHTNTMLFPGVVVGRSVQEYLWGSRIQPHSIILSESPLWQTASPASTAVLLNLLGTWSVSFPWPVHRSLAEERKGAVWTRTCLPFSHAVPPWYWSAADLASCPLVPVFPHLLHLGLLQLLWSVINPSLSEWMECSQDILFG